MSDGMSLLDCLKAAPSPHAALNLLFNGCANCMGFVASNFCSMEYHKRIKNLLANLTANPTRKGGELTILIDDALELKEAGVFMKNE